MKLQWDMNIWLVHLMSNIYVKSWYDWLRRIDIFSGETPQSNWLCFPAKRHLFLEVKMLLLEAKAFVLLYVCHLKRLAVLPSKHKTVNEDTQELPESQNTVFPKHRKKKSWRTNKYKTNTMYRKKVRETYRECYNHKPQPFPDTKWKRKQTKRNKCKSNKRTKNTKISSLFPKRGNRNAKRTENTRTK